MTQERWSGRQDSNLRPHAPKACALAKLSYAPQFPIAITPPSPGAEPVRTGGNRPWRTAGSVAISPRPGQTHTFQKASVCRTFDPKLVWRSVARPIGRSTPVELPATAPRRCPGRKCEGEAGRSILQSFRSFCPFKSFIREESGRGGSPGQLRVCPVCPGVHRSSRQRPFHHGATDHHGAKAHRPQS